MYEQDVRQKIRNLHWAPIVYAAAISGQSVDKYDYFSVFSFNISKLATEILRAIKILVFCMHT